MKSDKQAVSSETGEQSAAAVREGDELIIGGQRHRIVVPFRM
jgi:hypothetical protein